MDLAQAARGKLDLCFTLEGRLDDILIPGPAPIERTDGLWKHSCFEVFIRPEGGEAYYEVNLSPSRAWAAYRFEGYRAGMTAALAEPPATSLLLGREKLLFTATLTGLPANNPWDLGLSAVIEAMDGSKSYWALVHPPGKPDFHHRDCFALRLPPAA